MPSGRVWGIVVAMLAAVTSESKLRSLLIEPFRCSATLLMEGLLWVAISSAAVAGWVLGILEVVEEEEEVRKDFIVMLLEGPQEENLLAFRERLRIPVVLECVRERGGGRRRRKSTNNVNSSINK